MEKQERQERQERQEGQGQSDFVHAAAWVWILALLCYAALAVVLYLIEHKLYRGVFTDGNTSILNTMGIWLVVIYWRSEIEPPPPAAQGRRNALLLLGKALLLAAGAYIALRGLGQKQTYPAVFRLIFLFPLVLLPPRAIKRVKAPGMAVLLPGMCLVGTVAGVLATGYISQPRAEAILRERGYEKMIFQDAVRGSWLKDALPESGFSPEDMETPVYLFSAEKGGEPWAVAVSPSRGVIIGEMPVSAGSEIKAWFP